MAPFFYDLISSLWYEAEGEVFSLGWRLGAVKNTDDATINKFQCLYK